jgi:aspartate aminotransferase-like enzyme
MEADYLDLYNRAEANLQTILGTKNKVTIHTGEGMLGLWGALKSCLLPGDRVLSISTGVFGTGIGEMAKTVGAEVRLIELPFNQTIGGLEAMDLAIREFKPKMITAVHCETPSGTLNPIKELGALKKRLGVPLLYVDAVASAGGVPVEADACHIDLCLGGSQKALSVPPAMTFVSVSDAAWEIIQEVKYAGYDAFLPFYAAQRDFYFPYTPYWQGTAALNMGAELLIKEGLTNSYTRHEAVAQACRTGLQALGLDLFPAPGAVSSPTVTAVNVPDGITWPELDARFRAGGLVVGGSYGPMAGRVFRLGHMGSQADIALLGQALAVIGEAVKDIV